ncbi:MAG TPA: aldehyde dehydrogenase family protein [Pelagibacterium sp.]|uniref:L-piperidine-6-carboxylate dehydrogenase n=1 Tax=Pelagibacterium sp. TaxID=1967288 RepID=UPI002BD5A839|nr:aldehyde dehydrogenase family protein [Pelagibacterium sp.]HWJ86831.1 aldehyde dehydrogenase family protein [Pelagibacterium sp.]
MSYAAILSAALLTDADLVGGDLVVDTPIDGARLGAVASHDRVAIDAMIAKAKAAFEVWKLVPAPRRGELIRLFGEELRAAKTELGALVSLETGKIVQEGLGEVQEMIDICDLAVGQARQLFGLTIASERPGHSMRESWHPLGVTGVISAFNFPVAVFAWNFALATVCGNATIWKPSEKAPLSALAVSRIFEKAVGRFGEDAPEGLLQLAIGGAELGEALTASRDVPLVSATGSTRMGRIVGPKVAERFGRTILELGGNNAMIVAPSADLENAVRAIVFSAVGTCGQRCTSLRRLIVHEDVREQLVERLKTVYAGLPIGNPLDAGTLVGPLIDAQAFDAMQHALDAARAEGGVISGGERIEAVAGGHYVRPALVEIAEQTAIVQHETFAPILYIMPYRTLDEAIALQNGVPQGLSSCIFSTDVRETETFLSAAGSDCGIANVNIGPSGAEIGGAFGGEKETGGGRESGSDAWKGYMRRQTNTINYSTELPLAQGIQFDI